MRPVRGGFGGGGLGGNGLQSAAGRLAVAVVVGSVLFALGSKSGLADLILLSPARVVGSLALWQQLSYAFIATEPFQVIFCALITYSIGSALEQTWGPRRFLWVAIGYTVAAGILTVLLSFLFVGLRWQVFGGGTVMLSILWVAFGWSWGRAPTGFWGIPVTGDVLALIGIGLVFLQGAFGTWLQIIPEAIGILLVFVSVKLGARAPQLNPRLWWLRFQHRRLEKQLRGRSKHLRVVGRDDDEPPRRDYLN